MPKFRVTSPDGQKFEITAPDGATQEQALAYAQQQFSATPKKADGLDTSSLDAFRASVAPKPQPKPADFPGSNTIGQLESAASVGSGLVAPIAGSVAGVATRLTGAPMSEADKTAGKVTQALTYEPRTPKGKENVESIGKILESTKLAGMPPTVGGFPAAGVNVPKRAPKAAPVAAAAKPSAAAAVDELQAQKGVMAGDKVRDLGNQSAYEAALLERDKRATPLRQFAFKMPDRVQTKDLHSLIDKMESSNPDKKVRAALKEVRQTLKNAEDASGKSTLPAAGSKISAADYKKLSGQQGSLSVEQLDEVRQSIGRLLDATGDAKLDSHTAGLLKSISNQLVNAAPENYRAYLQEYSRLSKPLEQFSAAGNARDLVTADKAAFHMLNEADKQNMLESAFKSDTPGRALGELVRDTKHNPQALASVRQSYADWLTAPDAMSQKPTAKGLVKRWEDTKAAAKSSGLMTEQHIADMDKIMNDVRSYENKNVVGKAWASTAGFFLGNAIGHPITGAHLARDLVVKSGKEGANKALDAVMRVASDPNGAALLSAPPTPANIEKIRVMLPADLAAVIIPQAARAQQVRRPDPLSMQPAGL